MSLGFGAVPGEVIAVGLFLLGVVLVVASVEEFVEAVAEAAHDLGVSAFLLTVLLAGVDLENVVLGLAAVFGDLPDVALGTVFGEAMFVLAAAAGLAGLLVPFETDVPRSYLLLVAISPILFFVLSLDGGLSRLDGALLVVGFLPLFAVVVRRETNADTQYVATEDFLDDAEEGVDVASVGRASDADREAGWRSLAVAFAAVVGMTVGSELAVEGARGLLGVLDVSGLAFGATVLSVVASLEELFLTVTPARRGHPHLSVGNIIGSVLFFVTANAGVLALVHPLEMSAAVQAVHWPFFGVTLALVVVMLYRGRVTRLWGALLVGVYVAYWVVAYLW